MGRIRYGFKNLYYAIATADESTGVLTYETPVRIMGAKSMSMDPAGNSITEYADDGTWFSTNTNSGYTGSIEFEDTDSADLFMQTCLGQTKGANGGVLEKDSDEAKEMAILGQFTLAGGEEVGKRICFYRVIASRPTQAGQTKEDNITVQTNTVNLTAMPRIADGAVKFTAVSTDAIYTDWFTAVPEATTTTTTS